MTISAHLSFCPPAVCLPVYGLHTKSCLGMHPASLLATCPSHLSLLFLTIVSTVSMLALALMSVFLCFSLIDTPNMIRRHRITKHCSRFICFANGAHVSLPYNRVGKMAALNILIFVLILIFCWYHRILHKFLKLLDAFLIRTLISLSSSQSDMTILPKYSNSPQHPQDHLPTVTKLVSVIVSGHESLP